MSLKIRLRKQGRTNRPFYRLVVVPTTTKRDGAYVESLGWYNPFGREDEQILIHADRLQKWLDNGVELSDNAQSLIAQAHPAIMKQYKDKALAKKAKETAKRRERRRKAAAAA